MAMGSHPVGRGGLWGRERECALLDELIGSVRRGESRSLLLRGEAGIGKTALLERLISSADGLDVIRASGVESEMELAFAGLHQLCAPMLAGVEGLPGPQRDALQIAFGLSAGPTPDRFLVGLAALTLISQAADRRPLLCVVDDAQWLDQSSALTLAFVTRRLLAEPVGVVLAARDAGEAFRHVDQIEVEGLVNGDARGLLESSLAFTVDARIRDRIIAETRGNPLALVELPRGLTPTQLAGGFEMPRADDVANRIEATYARRLNTLPDDAQWLLLVAAAEPIGDPLLLQQACDRLGIALSAVDATDGLLTIDARVAFRHPLARSAVYRAAGGADRRAAHLALAAVTDPETDPDRRAWHLAAAAAGPDEDVARELERSAGRARARGGLAAAAAFLRRSAALTGDPARRGGRALAAADATLSAGAFDHAERLIADAEAEPLDPLGRARLDRLRAELAFARRRGGDAPELLLRAAQHLEQLDPRLARETYLDAWAAALFAGPLAGSGGTLHDVSHAALAPGDPARPADLLLDGLARIFTDGRVAATSSLTRAIEAFSSPEISEEDLRRWGWLASRGANALWDHAGCLSISGRVVRLARDAGALESLAVADNAHGQAAVFAGDFATATSLAVEVETLRDATGTLIPPHAAMTLAGFRGREAEATDLLTRAIAEATAGGQGTAVQYAHWATAVLMNGLGRYDDACASAALASADVPELSISAWATSELVEAAARTHQRERGEQALSQLRRQTEGTDSEWALGLSARAHALLSDGDTAELLYREAIDRLGRTALGPELARSQLLYGEWLRREHRRRDARVQLRAAHARFESIGMEAFADRARRELLATGETVRRRADEHRDELTPQERQIALLARGGLSNPEIGAQLFLSPRTVEWHLGKVFSKLGLQSRRQLRTALASSAPGIGPG